MTGPLGSTAFKGVRLYLDTALCVVVGVLLVIATVIKVS